MPQTLFQRIVAGAMLITSALLLVLAVRETTQTDEPRAAATVAEVLAAVSPTPTVSTPARSTPAKPTPAKTVPRTPPAPKAPRKQPLTRLVLQASAGDSWLDIRAESAQGKILYAGTLAQGGVVDVKAKQLWVRFGAAGDLTARLNGKPLPLSAGTYNALISRRGLQFLGA